MIQEQGYRREYIDGSVYDEDYYERGGHGSLYHGYTKSLLEHPGFKEFARLIAKVFQPEKVLEVGCATGIIVNHLRNLGIAATGIDISDYATKNAVCDGVLRASATHLPFADDSFDLVFGCHCIEHIPPFLLDKAVAEQARVSRRWVFHVMPIWKLGPYQWTPQEREELLNRTNNTDLNLEDVVWWASKFMASGRLRYRPDVRLRGVTKLWRDDYNFCQVCFEKDPVLDGVQRLKPNSNLASDALVSLGFKTVSVVRQSLPYRAARKFLRLVRFRG